MGDKAEQRCRMIMIQAEAHNFSTRPLFMLIMRFCLNHNHSASLFCFVTHFFFFFFKRAPDGGIRPSFFQREKSRFLKVRFSDGTLVLGGKPKNTTTTMRVICMNSSKFVDIANIRIIYKLNRER